MEALKLDLYEPPPLREWSLTIPGEPISANRYWRIGRSRIYKSALATAFKKRVKILAGDTEPHGGPVEIVIRYYHQHARRRQDTSNVIKVLEDSLQGVLILDDKQTRRISCEAIRDAENPRLEVTVREL